MARSIRTIYDEMIAEKESNATLQQMQPNVSNYQTFLSDLTTTSKVAVWRTLFFVVAVAIWTVEKLFDEHIAWIEKRSKELIVGNAYWYQRKCLEYQEGDALVFNGTEFTYPVLDETKRIVKLASVTESDDGVLIKVARLSGDTPIPMTPVQLDGLKKYISRIKFAGIKTMTVSRPADLLKVNYKVYIDPLVININGELVSNPSTKPVEDVIHDYIKNLPFDGVFTITDLTDKLQAIEGVVNPVIQSCDVKYGVFSYQPVGDFYTPNAGYLQVDSSFPLSGSITYLIP